MRNHVVGSYIDRQLVRSNVDKVLVKDTRVLHNMLAGEKTMRIEDYCHSVQTEIAPHMRKIVVDWMLEVCEDQQCQPEVFFLAVNYLDRFLSTVNIKKSQFQLLASVCILLASKFSQVVSITSEQLVIYTDNLITCEMIKDWEIQVLDTLQWEMSASTAHSFLEHFFNRDCLQHCDKNVRRQAENIAAIAATEYKFITTKQSVIAAAALALAVNRQDGNSLETLAFMKFISRVANCDISNVFNTISEMKEPSKELLTRENYSSFYPFSSMRFSPVIIVQ